MVRKEKGTLHTCCCPVDDAKRNRNNPKTISNRPFFIYLNNKINNATLNEWNSNNQIKTMMIPTKHLLYSFCVFIFGMVRV